MKKLFVIIGAVIAGLFLLIVGPISAAMAISWAVTAPECKKFAELSGYETYYSFSTDCLVKQNGQWVKWEVVVKNKQEITIKNKGE